MPSFSMFLFLSMIKLKNSALNFRERNEPNRQFVKIKLYGGFGSKSHYFFLLLLLFVNILFFLNIYGTPTMCQPLNQALKTPG